MNKRDFANGLNPMIDTVCIRLDYPQFRVIRPELFSPDPFEIKRKEDIPRNYDKGRLYKKYTQNRNGKDRMPFLTGYRRYKDGELLYELHVQINIPKMLFGNNLQELCDIDLNRTVSMLSEKLAQMGIEVTDKALKESVVNVAHFGKNIWLPYPLTVHEAIEELEKTDVGDRMEVTHRDYKNEGETLYFYTSAHNIAFYDKVKEIMKTRNVSMEKIKTEEEKSLLEERLSGKEQILRMEVRLNGVNTVSRYVTKHISPKPAHVSFKAVFSEKIAQGVLLEDWNNIVGRPENQLAFKMLMSKSDVFNVLLARARDSKVSVHSLNRTLISYGLYGLVNEHGSLWVRKKLETIWSSKSCGTRLNTKMKEAAVLLSEVPDNQIIAHIGGELRKFNRFDFANYEA